MTKKVCGYTGKGLRINLTTQEVKVEATFPRFKDDIGGTAIGYKVFWEEVDPKTSCYDPENKLVIAPGPLSGTGAICSGRTAITTLWPTAYPQSLISSAHVGGELAHKLKFAGWDFVIIEGESAKPIYLYINNDKVECRDASAIWGQGTYRSASMLAQETRPDVSIGTIGPAGENGVPMSNMMVDRSHSAGGIGSIMGKKKLKALVVWGDGAVHIAASPKQWEELVDQHRSILGAHTQSIVPRNPSPLHEYYTPASRWSAYPGAVWGAANPPVTITEKAMDPHDLNHIGYRTCSSEFYLGKGMWQYTVRSTGCYACPIRCYSVIRDDHTAQKYGIQKITEQTCMPLYGRWWFPKLVSDLKSDVAREANLVGVQTIDDMGIWCNYGQLHRDFRVMYEKGLWKKVLPKEEYESIDWNKIENPDPSIFLDILPRIVYRKGEFGRWLGETTPVWLKHFGMTEEEWQKEGKALYWAIGHTKHHSNENDGQIGVVLNCMYNRDPMCHAHINFSTSGLPLELQKKIAAKFWGDESAVDGIKDYRPTSRAKMVRLRWCIARKELHDMLGICSWTAPWELSPLREKGYIGDIEMESKVFSAVTGIKMTQDELDKAGLRAFLMQRLYTMRQLKNRDMRHVHDRYPEWIFHDAKGRKPFTKGTIVMDRADIEKSFDLFFDVMDFDQKTGAPTERCIKSYGLDWMLPALKKEGLY